MNKFSKLLTGKERSHLCSSFMTKTLGASIHKEAVNSFLELRKEAGNHGFNLHIHSGFRSFEDQLSIWNRKARGELPVLNSDAIPIDINSLTDKELSFSILRWSALPGASRHHWGTDIDIYDLNAKPENYDIELIPEEVNQEGIFGPLHDWLDIKINEKSAYGFFRPYNMDRNGVVQERWHLSYSPVSIPFLEQFSIDVLHKAIKQSDILLKETLLDNLSEIFNRFIINIGKV